MTVVERQRVLVPSERELRDVCQPSDREITVVARSDGVGEEGRPAVRGHNLRAMLGELNPRTVTEGRPATPMVVLAVLTALVAAQVNVLQFVLPYAIPLIGSASFIALNAVVGGVTQGTGQVGGLGLGYLADRWVPRVWFWRVGYLWFGILATLLGFVTTAGTWVGVNALRGIGPSVAASGNPLQYDYYPISVRIRSAYFQQKVVQIVGVASFPLAAVITAVLGWQWALIAIGAATMVASLWLLRVRELPRGAIDGHQPPVAFAESLRIIWSIRTLRWVYPVLPFIGLLGVVTGIYAQLYFYNAYHLGGGARALIGDLGLAAGFVSLTFQGGIQRRLGVHRPERLFAVAGLLVLVAMVLDAGFAVGSTAPVVVPVTIYVALQAVLVMVAPTVANVYGLVVPPRVRSMATDVGGMVGLVTALFGPYASLVTPTMAGILLSLGLDPSPVSLLIGLPVFPLVAFLLFRASATLPGDIRTMLATTTAEEEVRRSREAGSGKLVVCRDLDVVYDGAQVLFGVDFDVAEGELVALLGTNGAGKSTLLRAISGIDQPSRGAIFIDGEDLTHAAPHAKADRGVVMVPGGHAVFPTLTVAENLRTALASGRRAADGSGRGAAPMDEVLGHFPILRERWDQVAGNLSGGEQQMLAMGQALLMRPRLLMIDELSLGLSPRVVDQLLEIVRRIHAEGTTVIVVEQSVNVAMSIARRCVFMQKGEIRYDGPTDQLMGQHEMVRSVFLGTASGSGSLTATPHRPVDVAVSDTAALEVDDVRVSFGGVRALAGAGLRVGAGEVVGVVGANGAGKTTLFDVISGFVRPSSGRVRLGGNEVTSLAPAERAKLGLARSFQDARLFGSLTVRDNVLVAMERHLESRSMVAAITFVPSQRQAERRALRRVDALIESLGLGAFANKFVRELSTGSRRIVDLACILAARPAVLLLDEPSSGLAQAETEELGPFIGRVRKELGAAVLVIEHDLSLVSAVADRLVVMRLGTVMCDGEPAEVLDDPAVVDALTGGRNSIGAHRSGEVGALAQ